MLFPRASVEAMAQLPWDNDLNEASRPEVLDRYSTRVMGVEWQSCNVAMIAVAGRTVNEPNLTDVIYSRRLSSEDMMSLVSVVIDFYARFQCCRLSGCEGGFAHAALRICRERGARTLNWRWVSGVSAESREARIMVGRYLLGEVDFSPYAFAATKFDMVLRASSGAWLIKGKQSLLYLACRVRTGQIRTHSGWGEPPLNCFYTLGPTIEVREGDMFVRNATHPDASDIIDAILLADLSLGF